MKKWIIGLIVAGVVLAGLVTAGSVYAQGNQPPADGQVPFGGMGRMMGRWGNGTDAAPRMGGGVLHDYMVAAFAEKFDLSVDELNERLAAGDHMLNIAAEQGLTVEEFQTLMLDVRTQAIDQALADGVITAEQAEWMKTNAGRSGGRGMMGRGRGGFGMGGGCPYFTQPAE